MRKPWQCFHAKKGTAVTKPEKLLLLWVSVALLASAVLPFVAQDQGYHQFADQRSFFGLPNALDSLSNLAFVCFAVWGLWWQWRKRLTFSSLALSRMATLFFVGFLATGIGSFWYHRAPDDAGLVLDRLGMVIAFAGVLGMAAAHRVSARAGLALGLLALTLGPLSVGWWQASGNVAPYALMQFGGIALVVWLMFQSTAAPTSAHGPNWAALIAAYVLAKLFESFDLQVFQMTHQIVSGHTLKHLAAACAALAVIYPRRSPD